MSKLVPALVLFLSLLLPAGAGESWAREPDRPAQRPWSDVDYWAGVLEGDARHAWQVPGVVVEFMGVQEGDRVADLGCGTGYFTWMLSGMVGDRGRVYAVDTEQAMLDYVMKRENLTRAVVVPILAAPDDPKLPAGELDLVLSVNTWHLIKNRSSYLPRLARSLNPGGRVVLIDWREGQAPVGPRPEDKLARDTVVREFERAKWSLNTESFALPYQYLLIFHPPKSAR